MYPLAELKKNDARNYFLAISDFLSHSGIDLSVLAGAIQQYLTTAAPVSVDGYTNFYGQVVVNPREIDGSLLNLIATIEQKINERLPKEFPVASGDTPTYIPSANLVDTSNLVKAAAKEDAPKIEQHLTTLRMRLKTRLTDCRWSVFSNYDALGIKSTRAWFDSLGLQTNNRVTVIDLSMLAHEALPYVCASIGRVLLEAREKLRADQR